MRSSAAKGILLTLVLAHAHAHAHAQEPQQLSESGSTYELEVAPLEAARGALPPGRDWPVRSYSDRASEDRARAPYFRTVEAAFPRLRLCYEAELLVNEEATGRVVLFTSIAPDGHVDFALAEGDELNTAPMMRCLVAHLQKLRFEPRKDDRWINVLVPIIFAPERREFSFGCSSIHAWNMPESMIAPSASGLDDDVVKQLKACWLARLRDDPFFEATTTLSVDFHPDGTMRAARIRRTNHPDGPFERCLVRRMQEWEIDTELAKVARHFDVPVAFTFRSLGKKSTRSEWFMSPLSSDEAPPGPDWWFEQ